MSNIDPIKRAVNTDSETPNYQLPTYEQNSTVNLGVNWNTAMNKIDTAMKENADNITASGGDVSQLKTDVESLRTKTGLIENNVTTLTSKVDLSETEIENTKGNVSTIDATNVSYGYYKNLVAGESIDIQGDTVLVCFSNNGARFLVFNKYYNSLDGTGEGLANMPFGVGDNGSGGVSFYSPLNPVAGVRWSLTGNTWTFTNTLVNTIGVTFIILTGAIYDGTIR